MNGIGILAAIYLGGCVLVALRFGWHMAFRLDRYDWHYGSVWGNFWMSVVLWPLLMTKPRSLVHPDFSSSTLGIDLAANARECHRLWATPPPCGSTVLYRPGTNGFDSTAGEFTFRASDVEQFLERRIAEFPRLEDCDEGAMLNCIRRRDESQLAPTELPAVWSGMEWITMALIQSEHTQVTCLECGERVARADIAEHQFSGVGRVFQQWVCPRQHHLLTVETARFHTTRS